MRNCEVVLILLLPGHRITCRSRGAGGQYLIRYARAGVLPHPKVSERWGCEAMLTREAMCMQCCRAWCTPPILIPDFHGRWALGDPPNALHPGPYGARTWHRRPPLQAGWQCAILSALSDSPMFIAQCGFKVIQPTTYVTSGATRLLQGLSGGSVRSPDNQLLWSQFSNGKF